MAFHHGFAGVFLTRSSVQFLSTMVFFLTAFLFVLAAVLLLYFLDQFFIGEDPVEWKTIATGITVYGLGLSFTIFHMTPVLKYVAGIRLIGALVAAYGSKKVLQVVIPG